MTLLSDGGVGKEWRMSCMVGWWGGQRVTAHTHKDGALCCCMEKMKYGKDTMQERGVSTCRYCLSVVVVGDKKDGGHGGGGAQMQRRRHGQDQRLLAEEGRDI